jgi:hypothetical protein
MSTDLSRDLRFFVAVERIEKGFQLVARDALASVELRTGHGDQRALMDEPPGARRCALALGRRRLVIRMTAKNCMNGV